MKKSSKKILIYIFAFIILFILLLCGLNIGSYLIFPLKNFKNPHFPEKMVLFVYANGNKDNILDFLKIYIKKHFPDYLSASVLIELYFLHRTPKKGRYIVDENITLWQLLGKITKGEEDPLKVKIGECLTAHECLKKLCENNLCNWEILLQELLNDSFTKKNKISPQAIHALFFKGTYEFYWSWKESKIKEVLIKEIKNFWTQDREKKAKKLAMNFLEVYILASIISEEYVHPEEIPLIASVYINRLRAGMPLQADPTIRYMLKLKNQKVNRILKSDLQNPSPFNTYLKKGLPPAPINCVEKFVIDSVLNAPKTNYFYFCAKEDLNGYHYFSATYNEHISKCRLYQKKINELGIKR